MTKTRSSPQAKVALVGTGNAFNTDGRGSQCVWIEPAGLPPFLVDAGPTALQGLQKIKSDPGRIEAAFFTHLHGDHIAGWPFLLLHALFVARRTRPIRVIGPRGTRKRLENLANACYEDLVPRKNMAFELLHTELPIRASSGLSSGMGFTFDTVPLDHHPTSIGYRFHLPGRTIAVSGDTRWCPGLEELSSGCDLLVLECTCLRKPDYAHISLEEIRGGLSRLHSKRIVLVHLSDDVARALAKRPMSRVITAEDGMMLRV